MASRLRTSGEKGVTLILGVASLVFIIPLLGLSIDTAVLYAVKGRLQSSVDGASLAAARALNLGQTTAAQATSAKQNAVNWFYANFPAGAWNTSGTQMDQSSVNVFDDPNNPHVRTVTVTASTVVPTAAPKTPKVPLAIVNTNRVTRDFMSCALNTGQRGFSAQSAEIQPCAGSRNIPRTNAC